ncbi:MAG TPA: MarR family transcriptional regulator [Vicinamibacterales bacterium]|nr:MarR family transcriptional regulator [Vicinamibacterales bacterium]
MPRPSRPDLLRQIDEMLRKVSAQSVLISDLVAGLVGLNATDLECLDLLLLAGPATAGRLGEHTGLTSGATTAVIDRLERAGFVRRRRDLDDRRRVRVEIVGSAVERIKPFYSTLSDRVTELNVQFTDQQLASVVDYMSGALAAGAEHVAWLQTQTPLRPRQSPATVRIAGRGKRRPRRAAARPGRGEAD